MVGKDKMDAFEAISFLLALRNPKTKYHLEAMQRFVALLKHPEQKYPIIHVAGTNGKGSVCAMLENIFQRTGYKTGLYTSPHLVYLGERIQVNRENLSPNKIAAYVNELRSLFSSHSLPCPTFFEFMTTIAFLHFAREKVDIAIVETGLGGRLDATNIIESPLACVIPAIGIDHTQQLGSTLAKIATEKAGIFKPHSPVVLGILPPEAQSVIYSIAREKKCPLMTVRDYFPDSRSLPLCKLEGFYQQINAATATLTCQAIKKSFFLSEETITEALRTVDWPGRWQRIFLRDKRLLILDTTHNECGVPTLQDNLQALPKKPVILTGVLGKERAKSLLPLIAQYAKKIVLFEVHQPKACSFSSLAIWIPSSFQGEVSHSQVETTFPSPLTCSEGSMDDILVVTGSIYLVGEVMKRLFS